MLAAAWRLHERHAVPYAIDYRDAWSLDVVEGIEAFGRASRAGRWESRLVANALAVWTVNEPIRDFYRSRYPDQAEKVVVARNGFDSDLLLAHADEQPSPGDKPLTFGYLGTVNLRPAQLQAIVDGWTLAREREPALRDARLVFRGHMGAGIAKAANANARIVADAAQAGVSYGGPVAKADVVGQYAAWDALVLALAGGPYVTSGKIFEYVSTGLPIVSAHQKDHAAADVLRDYPLWAPTEGLDPEHMAAAFARGARLALDAGHDERAAAREYAQQFERLWQLRPAVTALADAVTGATRSAVPAVMPETETVGENA
jgi:glycosyltransferase involved in cell wall biosynthesis